MISSLVKIKTDINVLPTTNNMELKKKIMTEREPPFFC